MLNTIATGLAIVLSVHVVAKSHFSLCRANDAARHWTASAVVRREPRPPQTDGGDGSDRRGAAVETGRSRELPRWIADRRDANPVVF